MHVTSFHACTCSVIRYSPHNPGFSSVKYTLGLTSTIEWLIESCISIIKWCEWMIYPSHTIITTRLNSQWSICYWWNSHYRGGLSSCGVVHWWFRAIVFAMVVWTEHHGHRWDNIELVKESDNPMGFHVAHIVHDGHFLRRCYIDYEESCDEYPDDLMDGVFQFLRVASENLRWEMRGWLDMFMQ